MFKLWRRRGAPRSSPYVRGANIFVFCYFYSISVRTITDYSGSVMVFQERSSQIARAFLAAMWSLFGIVAFSGMSFVLCRRLSGEVGRSIGVLGLRGGCASGCVPDRTKAGRERSPEL